jgi:hypothetical protein
MAAGGRILGQEVSVLILQDGVLVEELKPIRSFAGVDRFRMLDVGYLGEKSNRKDQVFDGMTFEFEMHVSKSQFWTFKQAVRDKAQRVRDITFNITGVFSLPDGTIITETYEDVAWGEIPTNVSERGDYVSVRMSGACFAPSAIETV